MAASNVRHIADADIPEFTTSPPVRPVGSKDTAKFKLDGQEYTLARPKLSLAMTMLNLAAGEDFTKPGDIGMDFIKMVAAFITYIEMEPPYKAPDGTVELRGQALIMHRLNDPKDDLDLPSLAEPINHLLEVLFDRPTGKPSASGGRPARTSKGGAAGTRSRQAATSTT